jgi:hypothetical protein
LKFKLELIKNELFFRDEKTNETKIYLLGKHYDVKSREDEKDEEAFKFF